MNTLGNKIKLTSYGESHGAGVGAVLDGFPSNYKIDFSFIQLQLSRRKPGQNELTTQRKEEDEFKILSGVFNGKSTGAPIHFFIENKDSKSKDYDHLKSVYRPSHADYTYQKKYGIRDYRGGGRSSARITAGWVAAGALVQQYLNAQNNIKIGAYVRQVGGVKMSGDAKYYSSEEVDSSIVRCPEQKASASIKSLMEDIKSQKDSLGGVIECVIQNLPIGVGNPVFQKLNAELSHAMFSINAVKGVEFGGGFAMASERGSQVNDQFIMEDNEAKTNSNFSGGIQGGISNGMDIVFRVAFKPTATIGVEQSTINTKGEKVSLEAYGRHDPCVVPRAVPIVETMAAMVIGNLLA